MLRYRLASKLVEPHLQVKSNKGKPIHYDSDKGCLVVGKRKYFDPNDYGFMRHLTNVHKCKEAPMYPYAMWYLLHQIGYYEVEEIVGSNKDNRQYMAEYGRILRDNAQLQNAFHNDAIEWEATEWAIKWVAKHKKLAKVVALLMK